jgi:hypothetical protein
MKIGFVVFGLSCVETDARLLLRERQEKTSKIYAYIYMSKTTETRTWTGVYSPHARNTDIMADYHSPSSEARRGAQLRQDVECDALFIRNASQQTCLVTECVAHDQLLLLTAVGTVTGIRAGQPRYCGSIRGWGRRLPTSQTRPDRLYDLPASCSVGKR